MATPITLFFLLTVASMLSNFSDSMVNANSEGDALIAFKKSLSDPTNALKNWDQTLVDPCTWFFVTCNAANQVTQLDLVSRNLAGHLVPQLGNLQYLQSLALNNNQLQGTIPTELGNLKSLVDLQLQYNSLTGTIPPSLGNLKSLVSLRLSNNRGLSGDVPQEVSNLPNLKVLDVSNTNVVGASTPRTRSPPAPGDDNTPLKNMSTPSLGLCRLFFLLPIVATLSCLF